MSSSNAVRVTYQEEVTYGVTPASGDFSTVRFISEALSGTPETTESAQIRVDRASSGQVVTGLTVGGAVSHELAKEAAIDDFYESAMYNTWTTSTPVSVDMTVDTTAGTITRVSGDFTVDLRAGHFITLTGFANTENNTQVMVDEVTSATVIKFIGKDLVDEVGTGSSYELLDYMDVGTTKKSFSMEKAFTDLTTKAINYRGMIVSEFSLSAAYGAIVTGGFTFSGNDYETVTTAVDFMTNGRTITDPATTQSLNGSVDMPFVASSASGTMENTQFCIQSVELGVNNNLTAQNCIGRTAPKDYSEGTAQISVTISAYLSDLSWELLSNKLSQESFALGFILKNDDGYYAYYMPAVQVSFDDPASAGQNQDVMISMSGVAKVGANNESPLSIYKS